MFTSIKKVVEKKQDDTIKAISDELNIFKDLQTEQTRKIEMEVLRLQILTGIDAQRLSYSEVLYFYDKYRALGGNSFVTEKVETYIANLNHTSSSKGDS